MSTSSSSDFSEPDQPSHPSTNEVVVGRCPRYIYWYGLGFVGFGLAMGICFFFDQERMRDFSSRLTIDSLLLVCFVLPGLLTIWATLRIRVIADAQGLRWRGIAGWKSATWPQVSNYYNIPLPQNRIGSVVETENGKIKLEDLDHGKHLKEIVQMRAKWASSQSWETKEHPRLSPQLTGPETFTVNRHAMRDFWLWLMYAAVFLPLIIIYAGVERWDAHLVLLQNLDQTRRTLGLWWAVGTFLTGLLPYLGLVALIAITWPQARGARQRRDESITVSPEGILWQNAATRRTVWSPWQDVIDYYVAGLPGCVATDVRYVIKTAHGNFDFVGYKNDERLRAVIKRYCAAQGLEQEWESQRYRQQQPLNILATNTFTYRHRLSKTMLWFGLALTGGVWGSIIQQYYGWAQHNEFSDILAGLFFAIPLSIGILWSFWRYFSFQIITDDKGITQRNGRRTKFIAWPEVEEYEFDSMNIVIRSQRQTLRCFTLIGNKKALMQIIETRAVNSKTHGW